MNTTIMNYQLLAFLILPIYYLILTLLRYKSYWGNAKLWTILFHFGVAAYVILQAIGPYSSFLLRGLEMLSVSWVLTGIIFLSLEPITKKKLQTIWKVPILGALLGLYLPHQAADILGATLLALALWWVFQHRSRIYIFLKPTAMLCFFFFAYQIGRALNNFAILQVFFGLISYQAAVKIMNMILVKDWMGSFEEN